mgnify:CR=1 FL=1
MNEINDLWYEHFKCFDEIELMIGSSEVKYNFNPKTKTKSEINYILNGEYIQFITAKNNSVINAIQKINNEYKQLSELTSDVRKNLLYEEDDNTELVKECLAFIEEEAKKIIRKLLEMLKMIKGSVKFSAALASLIEFCLSYFSFSTIKS